MLEPASAGPPILTISDPAALDEIAVVDFLPFPKALSAILKRSFARQAVRAIGVPPYDVHVVP